MKNFGLPTCPYCGLKVGPLRTWILKSRGEYKCIRCGGISNIILRPAVSYLAAAAILISILIFVVFRFIIGKITLESILYMLIPYAVFFLAALFMVELKRPIIRKRVPYPQQGKRPGDDPRQRPPVRRPPYSENSVPRRPAPRPYPPSGSRDSQDIDHTRIL